MIEGVTLTEAVIALVAGLGAWLSWRAKSEAQTATKEAEGANRAVNGNKDPNAPRLYDVVVDNAKMTAVIEDRVDTIKERQKEIDIKVESLTAGQTSHAKTLLIHSKQLECLKDFHKQKLNE